MKRGLWVLTFLGVAAGIAHHQLRAQEAEPLRSDRAASVALPDKPSDPVSPTDLTQPGGERPYSKAPRKELTAPEMRQVLKSWHAEEIDQLNHEATRKRFEAEQSRRGEAAVTERLKAVEKELMAIAQAYPDTPNGKQAESAWRALSKTPDTDSNYPSAPTFKPAGLDPCPNPYEITQEQLDAHFDEHVLPELLRNTKTKTVADLDEILQRSGMSVAQMRTLWRDQQRSRRGT